MAATLALCNWQAFQHYKDRDPPWVKLYRDLLTAESWVLGTDTSRLVQVASILLAARYSNKIPLRWDLIRKVASLECTEKQFNEAVSHLVKYEFLSIQEDTSEQISLAHGASTALATCTSEAEQRQSRAEQIVKAAAPPARAPPTSVSRETEPAWMLDFKLAYPERAGDQNWRGASRAASARLSEGHTHTQFIEGAKRYAAFCQSAGKTGTEFVQQASRFLGPGKPFLLPWTAPAERRGSFKGAPSTEELEAREAARAAG